MANQITDNRTLLFDGGDGTGTTVDLDGAAAGTDDTSTFIEGSTSQTISISNSVDGLLHDHGTAQDWSSNTFHIWINIGVKGLLLAKASGGCTVRFCGATVTDWFEVYVGGNDSWPVTFEGGWAMFVVDIEDAHTNSDATNGTKPATNAIRFVGVTAETSIMPKMADNFWLDAIWRNPTANPSAIVEGRNAGTTDWDFTDIATELGVSAGIVIPIDGDSFYVTGPIQFGINDTSTHGFTSLNDTILFADQEFVTDGYYKLSALGNAGGTTNVTFGAKSGTGDAATGAQGASIKSGSLNARFDMDFNDPNLDLIGFYGCSIIHSGDLLLDDAAVSFISTLVIDGNSALTTGAEMVRVSVIAANTADGVAYMTTTTLDDIVYSTFEFSDGHAIELTTPQDGTQASKGNVFTSYGATTSNDAAVYNNSGAGLVTINVTDGGSGITYRDGTSASTSVVLNPVTVAVHVQNIAGGADLVGARVYLLATSVGPLPWEDTVTITRVTTTATVAHTGHGLATNQWVKIEGADQEEYNGGKQITVTGANEYTYTVSGTPTTPATGTIDSTAIIIFGVTDSSGDISDQRSYSSDQEFAGWVRKSSNPYFKTSPLSGSISSADGLPITVGMIPDG